MYKEQITKGTAIDVIVDEWNKEIVEEDCIIDTVINQETAIVLITSDPTIKCRVEWSDYLSRWEAKENVN